MLDRIGREPKRQVERQAKRLADLGLKLPRAEKKQRR